MTIEQIDYPYIHLRRTPFFPQQEYQCGPAALATLLVFSGVDVIPEELAPKVYLPHRKGSLQAELIAATRRYGRIPYQIEPKSERLLDELNAGHPVLVLQNLGFTIRPVWHYAVVIGYDPGSREILLRSGTNRNAKMSVRKFMRTWEKGGYWAMVALKPDQVPARLDLPRYLKATVAMERTGDPELLTAIYQNVTERFPRQVIGWLGLANAYQRLGKYERAIEAYRRVVDLAPDHVAARNNQALALSAISCNKRALELARTALKLARKQNRFISQSRDTLRQIKKAAEQTALEGNKCAVAH